MSPFQRTGRRLAKPRQLLPNCIRERGGAWADLGCGNGVFAIVLSELLGVEATIFGVDRNRSALRRLELNFKSLRPRAQILPLCADFTKPLPLPPLNGILMANALHFVPDSKKGNVLSQLMRLLIPGGRFVLVEYNSNRGNLAVPHPLGEFEFLRLAEHVGLSDCQIRARVPSSFLNEMYAGVGTRPAP